jgi:hypothetical protein
MKTIRRLYFYLVAIISLEVVVWGVIGLLRSIIKGSDVVNGTEALAQALALIFVGVPIFLFHWLWSQNVSAKDAEERTASLRAIFLYGTLLATLIPAVQNTFALINRTFLSTANLSIQRAFIGGSQTLTDNILAIVINLLIAAYFWNILRNEWRALPDTENFAEIRRLYRFIWTLYGLWMVIYGAQQALSYAFTLSSTVLGGIGRETIVNAIALLVIGTPIWFFSWRTLQDALTDRAEKESVLRLGILYLLALGGVITTLTAAGNFLYILLLHLFGQTGSWANVLQKLGGPISIGIPFGAMWAYYGHWLNRQFEFDENTVRRAAKKRLYFYILSAIGLAASLSGMAALLMYLVDIGFDLAYLHNDGLDYSLAGALSTLIVGLPLWLMTWWPMQAEALGEGAVSEHARRSVIRRSYLYLALFAGVIGGMISAGILIFTLINAVLGGENSSLMRDVLHSLILLILFAVLLLYHLSALRRDGASRSLALDEKQADFDILLLDPGDGKFGESVRAAFEKQGLKVPVHVVNASEGIPADVKANAIILPASLAMNAPKNVEAWIRSFGGSRLIVQEDAAGVFWMNDFEQAAASAQMLAEGQELRPQSSSRTTSAWTYVAYVFAALFACQLVFILLIFGISFVSGGF